MAEYEGLLAEADEWVRIDLDRNGLVASLATAVRHLEAERDATQKALDHAAAVGMNALAGRRRAEAKLAMYERAAAPSAG